MKAFLLYFLLIFITGSFLKAEPMFVLRNCIIAGSEKSAVIENKDTDKEHIVTVGDSLNGYLVREIKPHRVYLESSTSILTLCLHSKQITAKKNTSELTNKKQVAFDWPSDNTRVISGFGYRQHPLGGGVLFHKGIDLPLSMETPVYAASSGIVSFAGRRSSYGILLTISHPGNYQTRYAHLSNIVVKPGDFVSAGDLVAYSGNTGRSTGPHLHFEIRKDGVPVDPKKYLPDPQ